MTASTPLERTYRLLLRSLPKSYRAEREDEMLGVLLSEADSGQRLPHLLDAVSLVRLGVVSRLGSVLAPGRTARLAAVLSLVLAVGGLTLAGSVLQDRGQFGASAARSVGPVLPRQLPFWAPVPASLGDRFGEPAIAYYSDGYEDALFNVVLGSSGSRMRKAPDELGSLLSPDGRFLVGKHPSNAQWTVRTTDLVTGRHSTVPGVRLSFADPLLAWSRDSRYLVWSQNGLAVVFDRRTGSSHYLGVPAEHAAFSLTDDRLAVQSGSQVTVLGLGGGPRRTYPVWPTFSLAAAGWSPGGSMVALISRDGVAGTLRLADGAVERLPPGVGDQSLERQFPLGWLDDHTLLAMNYAHPMIAYDLKAHTARTVVGYPSNGDSSMSIPQLATAMVPSMVVADTGPLDRGSLPWKWPVAALVAMLLAGALARMRQPASHVPRLRMPTSERVVGVLIFGPITLVFLLVLGFADLVVVEVLMGAGSDVLVLQGAVVLLTGASFAAASAVRRTSRSVLVRSAGLHPFN